jgi:hypothetical protein
VCWKPCSSCWSFHLLREEFLSAPIHSPPLWFAVSVLQPRLAPADWRLHLCATEHRETCRPPQAATLSAAGRGRLNHLTEEEATDTPDVMIGEFLVCGTSDLFLFDTSATGSYITSRFMNKLSPLQPLDRFLSSQLHLSEISGAPCYAKVWMWSSRATSSVRI